MPIYLYLKVHYPHVQLSLIVDGVYGTQNWFFNPKALTEPAFILDLDNWTMLNGLRGVTGILAYIFWCIVKEFNIEKGDTVFLILSEAMTKSTPPQAITKAIQKADKN